uniref:Rho-GAP domain-containing protein n=1 Tax=Macrostomum lignano TaxID=282301 RepID=A0A1I8FKU7_9PLAT
MLAELGRFSHNQLLELVCALFPSRSREDLDQVGGKRPARAGDEAAAQEAEERTQLMLEKEHEIPQRDAGRHTAGELKAIPSSYNSESLTPIDGSYDRSSSSGQRPSNSRGNDLPPLDDEFSSKKSSGKKKKHLPPLKPAVRRVVDETLSDERPMANETVHFRAIGTGQSVMQRWSLTNTQLPCGGPRQLPSARLPAGARRQAVQSKGFGILSRADTGLTNKPSKPESDYQPTSWSRVDIVKYIGLQRRIHSH